MAGLPQNLREQVERLEEMFIIPREKLKAITEHFLTELEKGMVLDCGRRAPRLQVTP